MKVEKKYLGLLVAACALGFVGNLSLSNEMNVQAATQSTVAVDDDTSSSSNDDYKQIIKGYTLDNDVKYDIELNKNFSVERMNLLGKLEVTTKFGVFTYSYSGDLGDTVMAKVEEDKEGKYKSAPLIKITIPSEIKLGTIPSFTTSGGENLETYNYNGTSFTDSGRKVTYGVGQRINYIARSPNQGDLSTGKYFFCLSEKDNEWLSQDYDNISIQYVSIQDLDWPVKDSNYVGSNLDGEYVESAIDGREVASKDKITADVTIDSNLGNEVAKDVTGTIGDTAVSVNVPEVSGYTADKKTVLATATRDGITVNPDQKVTYTKNQTHSNGGTTSSGETNIGYGYLEQTISTHPNQPAVKLYKFENNSLTEISNRALAPNSNWFTDQMLNFNGKRYYRVATNEWAKASDAYVYEKDSDTYKTTKLTSLVNSENEPVKNRTLAANTNWKVDRVAYLGSYKDPIKAYRVATNEFVIADK